MPYEIEIDWPGEKELLQLCKLKEPLGEWHQYDIDQRNLFAKKILEPWLNARGAKDWRLVDIDADFMCIFERKIEVNQTLRDFQLGIIKKEKKPDDKTG